MHTKGWKAAVVVAMLGTAALPGVAHATTASVVGGTIQIVDANGEDDDIAITPGGSVTDGKVWRISGVDPGAGCEPGGGGAMCSDGRFAGPTRSFDIRLGGGDDELDYAVSDSTSGTSPRGTIDLGAGDDEIDAGATESFTVLGGADDDTITLGGQGFGSGQPTSGEAAQPATVDGGPGSDLLEVGGRSTADVIRGGADFDTVTYAGRTFSHPVSVTLDGIANDGSGAEGDNVANDVESLIGTAGADTLVGDGGDQTLDGGLGADTLNAQGGNDTLSFAGRATAITANLTTGADTDGDDLAFSFENLRGGAGPDVLTGNGIANRIEGGAGDDTLDGRGAADQLIGQGGLHDMADYSSRPGPVVASLDGVANDPDGDTLDVEDLRGTPGNDKLIGGTASNRLFGLGGDDKLDGRAGNDVLSGGAGNDLIGPLLAIPTGICLPHFPGPPVCTLHEFVTNPLPDGIDVIDGGDGNDRMSSVDGVADASLSCGAGTDGIEVDATDPAPAADCENVIDP